jgi:Type I phosphodiesterase / nucleotide pyrophosphatase
MIAMSPDELALQLQRLADRLIRRCRLGPAPERSRRRRFLVIQIDGLSRAVLEHALARGHMPFLARLLRRQGFRLEPMSVSLPTSTPAFQMAAFYGVEPDIPGFHYHDKRRGADVYFPRGGDAAGVEQAQARGRRGILEEGSAYGCVFTGGAVNNLFNFTNLKRPTGAGLLRAVAAFVVLAWVLVKGIALTLVELVRAVLRFLADPVGETARGWKWLAIKVGVSVWVRHLFTLVTSRDLYAGVPAVYVNYLDYDVFAHAFGPRHRLALRALRRLDRSMHVLWRVVRRVPEHRYDVYVLADHGQAATRPYAEVSDGRRLERVLLEDLLQPAGALVQTPTQPGRPRLAQGIQAYRRQCTPGVLQRFINYLERDFPWVVGDVPEAEQRAGVRVVSAGPNAFVYFLTDREPVPLEELDRRFPGLADEISRTRGVGFVLARSGEGPVCLWRGKRYLVDHERGGPLVTGRADGDLVVEGIRALMAMPSAGDLVIYGNDSPDGNISFIPEHGAHAGPSAEEMQTFIVCPANVTLKLPITRPTQLYPHFLAYQET